MAKNGEESEINQCLLLIESKLGWGSSNGWVHYDFEKLSDIVNDSTGVRLSTSTLKRIWGKLKYDHAPTLTTLNTLAQFAGYTDWRNFRQEVTSALSAAAVYNVVAETAEVSATQVSEPALPAAQPARIPVAPVKQKGFKYYWFLALIPLSLLGYTLISSKQNSLDSNAFSFRTDKMIAEGVPNSVVFHYDARAAATDSVFIVQTWDITRKKLVPKNQHEHSAIYYYPGFFNTKLIADNQIVKAQDLWITSRGWLCLAEDEPVPLYFKDEECLKDSMVAVDEHVLKKYNLPLYPKAPRIRFFNQRDMGDLMSDNFTFETVIKNNFDQGTNTCQPVQVLIQCKNDIIIIPLAARPCIGDMSLAFCGTFVSSKNTDLSKFGANLTQWTKLRVETVNKHATLFVNGVKAYSLTFPNKATGIVGVQIRLNGTGAVKDTWFEGKGKVTRF
ncbi:MAG: hypothetical protein ABIN80_06205 [Dyadobacter sp.]|uniref:hypothetical protein n=1 Tax=Dyadobacter sp. TaxID=1914288 RepID=UPI003265F4DF